MIIRIFDNLIVHCDEEHKFQVLKQMNKMVFHVYYHILCVKQCYSAAYRVLRAPANLT